MKSFGRMEQIAGIAAVGLVIVGCFVVLRPFVSPLLWAGILCYSTWPFFTRLDHLLGRRRTLAALLMTAVVGITLVLPFAVVGLTLADNMGEMIAFVSRLRTQGVPAPPEWIATLPVVGPTVSANWNEFSTNTDKAVAVAQDVFVWSRGWLLRNSIKLGQGVLQLTLSVFIAFFFYRNGETAAKWVSRITQRLVGSYAQRVLEAAGGTVKGVVYGILGTAVGQGVMAAIGFMIAGVPSALLLGLVTFFLSLLPAGPPLVWVPAALWLFFAGRIGAGVFMVIWGVFAISGIDNLLRPYIISRGANLPFIIILLGVLGGILAFGFLGLFLGPTLLAVGLVLMREWTKRGERVETASAPAQNQPPV